MARLASIVTLSLLTYKYVYKYCRRECIWKRDRIIFILYYCIRMKDAFKERMRSFISKSRERQRLVALKSEERRYQSHLEAEQQRTLCDEADRRGFARSRRSVPASAPSSARDCESLGPAHSLHRRLHRPLVEREPALSALREATVSSHAEGTARMSARSLNARLGSHRRTLTSASPARRMRLHSYCISKWLV